MPEPSKEELLRAASGSIDTEQFQFDGLRGDRRLHLTRAALEAGLANLPPAPRDRGTVHLLVARGRTGERFLHDSAQLTREGGMPGDRWAGNGRYGPDYQLATTRSDFARLVANGQPLELHGDNLYLHLDISSENLPAGSLVQLGGALTRVTRQAHNGCKKWVQRFGLDAMQLNLANGYRNLHLRGIYLQVVEDGLVRVGDPALVVSRATAQ
ncbi:MAG TPA: hypothetical protein VG937_10170 [Polyangiaceae bacterium]|jgi:hypothetical protein|nr:hypothetical protein [Polyangiaceae bacterium]